MHVLIEKPRQWQRVGELDKIEYLFNEKLKEKVFYLKHTFPPAEFNFVQIKDHKFEFYCPADFTENLKFTLFINIKRQIEVDFEQSEVLGEGHVLLRAVEVRISKVMRESVRIKTDESIYADNFRISRITSYTGTTKNSLTNQVIFQEFDKKDECRKIPGFHIHDAFSSALPEELKKLMTDSGSLVIFNSADPSGFASGEGFSDPVSVFQSEAKFKDFLASLQKKGIVSFAAVPVVLSGIELNKNVTAAFVQGTSDSIDAFSAHLEQMKNTAAEISERIRDANSVIIRERQKVINISDHGFAIELQNEELKEMMPERKNVVLDIIFRKQAPLKFQTEICHVEKVNGNMIAGLSLQGSGHTDFSKSNLERLKTYLKSASGK